MERAMTLQDISYAMRAAVDVARAGENLLASMDRSRRGGVVPILFAVALGVGIGALVFRKDVRQRLLEWAQGMTIVPVRSANGATAEPAVTFDAAHP
jgi:hypothetical protein